jgi:peptide subunit release factor 1 (eRF1)
MVDVIDRGQQTGLVLMSHDRIRLLEWADGHAEDLEYSVYDLELGDWRDYRGPAPANPARAQQSASHAESYSDRVEAWRAKFSKAAAANIAESASDLGMRRLVIAADGDLGKDFVEALPQGTRDLVIAQVPTNLIDMSAAEAAEHLDPHLRDAWKEKVNAIAADAIERAKAGGKGAVGPDEVMLALAEGRVEHLLLDPYLELDERDLSEGARQAITDAGEASFREAAVEAAIRTHAAVSSASVDEVPALAENQGIVALLRY